MADAALLETFVVVARLGSMQRAAVQLHRSQPSLSARLAALEGTWGTRLFARHSRGVTLTPEGSRLLPLAETALAALARVDQAAGVPLSGRAELRLGAGDALGRVLVPRALARLLEEEPGLSVRMLEGPRPRLLEALRGGDIDLALVVAEGNAELPGLELSPLIESRVEALFPLGEPASKMVRLVQLRGRRLVMLQSGSAFRRHVERSFDSAGVPFQPSVEVGNLSLVRRFVAAGLGVGLVPSVAFSRGDDPLVLRRAVRGVPPLCYSSVRRSGVPWAPAVRRFIELLRSPEARNGAGRQPWGSPRKIAAPPATPR